MKNLENYHSWGTPQKLSEGFSTAPDFHYETKIGSPSESPGNLYPSLFKTPTEWGQDVSVDAGHVRWHIEITQLNGGFDIENVIIDEIKLVIQSMEDVEDGMEHNFTMEISQDQLDPLKAKYSIDSLPFIMNDLDITMNGSEDPHDWNIDITLGIYEHK